MSHSKSVRRTSKGGTPNNREEGESPRNIESLEKKDWNLWLLTIFVILVLTLFIVINFFYELSGTPRDYLQNNTFLTTYIISSAVLLILFCLYTLMKNKEIRRLRREIFASRNKSNRMTDATEEVRALFQVISGISEHKEMDTILEMVARESLHCLNAHRSTIFQMDGAGILKTQFTLVPDPQDEQIGLFEEKEMARKSLKQKRSFLLREPKDFSVFFKYEERDRKITSLVMVPFAFQGKAAGALSTVMINGERNFGEKDLQLLSIFAHQVSLAMENAFLTEEVHRGFTFRKNYDQYLDDILNQLQNLSEEERRRIEEHIGRLIPSQKTDEKKTSENQVEERITELDGTITMAGEPGSERREEDRVEEVLQVELDNEIFGQTNNLSSGGVFIRTPNPLDLGEQFLLKLNMVDGQDPIEVTCKVIWTNKYGKENKDLHRGMGVKFINLPPEAQKRVDDYLRSQRSKGILFEEERGSLRRR